MTPPTNKNLEVNKRKCSIDVWVNHQTVFPQSIFFASSLPTPTSNLSPKGLGGHF
jgi:hypothetical protein